MRYHQLNSDTFSSLVLRQSHLCSPWQSAPPHRLPTIPSKPLILLAIFGAELCPDPLFRIVIVGGAGTIGSSTALHLCRRGYKDVTILDVYGFPADQEKYGPSQSAGASDINKHIGATHSGTRGEITELTMDMWRTDPVFKDHYHEVGEVSCEPSLVTGRGKVADLASQLSAAAEPAHIAELRESYEDQLRHPVQFKHVKWLGTRDEIVRHCPHLANAQIDGWQGIWNAKAGWGAANDAVDSVGRELKKFGVRMVFGE